MKGAILKIDLSKAYDRVSWLYIWLLLTHFGLAVPFIKWIMSYISTVSFAVLINGSASHLFHLERGLRHGFPLSLFLFLLDVEGLSRAILEAKRLGSFSGIKISQTLQITHLLFVDDVLIFSFGSRRDVETLKKHLKSFLKSNRHGNK
jgi:hypothetical protein